MAFFLKHFLRYPFRRAVLATLLIMILVGTLASYTRVFDSIDRVIFDWRIALLGDRLSGTHPDIALIEIDEESISGTTCRSPLDRLLLAQVISMVTAQAPRAVGVNFLLDRSTEAVKDNALRDILNKAPIILPVYKSQNDTINAYNDYVLRLASELNKPVGYFNLRREIDGVIRRPFEVPSEDKITNQTFAARVAEVGGWTVKPVERIAWLRPPKDGGDTFRVLRASELLRLSQDNRDSLRAQIAGKAVLIGSALSGFADRYTTPLSTLYSDKGKIDEDPNKMSGLEVNAQMLAQIIDMRDYNVIGRAWIVILTVFAAFFGTFYGWFFKDVKFPTGFIPWICFLVLDAILFSAARVEIPFIIPATSWQMGAYAGQWLMGMRYEN